MSTETTHQTGSTTNGTPSHKAYHRTLAVPPIDVYENADEVLVVADIPGVSGDELSVHVEGNVLRFESEPPVDALPGKVHTTEFGARRYARTLRIPTGIDAEKISAEAKNGTLVIRLPKLAQAKPRQIPVRSS